MPQDKDFSLTRRTLLKAGVATGLAACTTSTAPKDPIPTEEQIALRKKGRSTVGIIKCANYDEDIFSNIKQIAKSLQLPNLKGKQVLLKPNMVEYRNGNPVTTNPAIVQAAIQLVGWLGAKTIVVGDGPAEFRDTEFLLEKSGIGKVCKASGVQFIDLNLDSIVEVNNNHGFIQLKKLVMPKTVMEADAVISLPKLKTHHWAGMTCSLKNLFGTVPGRKYGFPKNVLHYMGIDLTVIDLAHIVKPAFALVDGIVSMEGEGPMNGQAKDTGFVVLGSDLAAVDATCARTMKLEPTRLKYLRLAGLTVGNIKEDDIDIIGVPITQVAQEFVLPEPWQNGKNPTGSASGGT